MSGKPADAERVQQARRDFEGIRGQLTGMGLDQRELAVLAEIDGLQRDHQAATDRAVALRRAGGPAAVRQANEQQVEPTGELLDQRLQQLADEAGLEITQDAAAAERAMASTGRLTILLPAIVILAGIAMAVLLLQLVLRGIAKPFRSAGADVRSNADQLSAAVQQLATTTAEQSSGVAETSATMEELARAAASIAETVADEVRRLAERSKASAAEIAKVIEGAQSESNATVLNMERSARQMQEGLSLLGQVADATARVRLTTQQQRSATEQVVVTLEQISNSSGQVSATAQQIAASAGDLASLAANFEQAAVTTDERL